MADGNAELRKLIRDFKKLPPALRKELRPALKKGAQPILADARRRASWSTRIPKATRLSTSFTARRGGVKIVVSAKRAPHGRPYENLGDPGTFRHPVFAHPRKRDMVFGREIPGAFKGAYKRKSRRGDKGTRWVDQAARPYLFDAVEAKGGAVTEALAALVMEIGVKHGWNR